METNLEITVARNLMGKFEVMLRSRITGYGHIFHVDSHREGCLTPVLPLHLSDILAISQLLKEEVVGIEKSIEQHLKIEEPNHE